MVTVITVVLWWVETVWSPYVVTGWLEMLMLTGEGVGMALAHDLSPLLRTVTFYSLDTLRISRPEISKCPTPINGCNPHGILGGFYFSLRNSTILCLNYV